MKKVKYVYVILIYRNTSDLVECLASIKETVDSCAVVVVNAFYSKETDLVVKQITEQYQCDLINVENKGYSFGNNVGIDFARKNFIFEYVIISNPDIIISKFNDSALISIPKPAIIAPKITAASGRLQNPMSIRYYKVSDYLEYVGFKKDLRILLYIGILISKFQRALWSFLFKIRNKSIYRIYAAHGSHVILSKEAVEKLWPVYDENIFLFAEEGVLAIKAKRMCIPTYYYDGIQIMHKEDGSMKLSALSVNNELKKANIYYYETYVK